MIPAIVLMASLRSPSRPELDSGYFGTAITLSFQALLNKISLQNCNIRDKHASNINKN